MPKTGKFDVLGNTSSGKDKNNFAMVITPINKSSNCYTYYNKPYLVSDFFFIFLW